MVHLSPMGLVPKPHQPNKFLMVVDLFEVALIQTLGRGTRLVKIDLKDAYRMVPVHPDDYHLLGVSWKGHTFVDRALPFGLCSAL